MIRSSKACFYFYHSRWSERRREGSSQMDREEKRKYDTKQQDLLRSLSFQMV